MIYTEPRGLKLPLHDGKDLLVFKDEFRQAARGVASTFVRPVVAELVSETLYDTENPIGDMAEHLKAAQRAFRHLNQSGVSVVPFRYVVIPETVYRNRLRQSIKQPDSPPTMISPLYDDASEHITVVGGGEVASYVLGAVVEVVRTDQQPVTDLLTVKDTVTKAADVARAQIGLWGICLDDLGSPEQFVLGTTSSAPLVKRAYAVDIDPRMSTTGPAL